MMTGVSMLFIGFLLGMKHATETDHLAAVATLINGQSSLAQTLRQGVAWGIGHAVTLMLIGGIVLLLGKAIPPKFSQGLEFAVGVMLILLGADVLRRLIRNRVHFHGHSHPGAVHHIHAHSHAGELSHRPPDHQSPGHHRLPVRALAVGMLHGMAGSAALILLSLQAAQSIQTGLLYIGLFAVGSIVGMAALSVAIAVPMRLSLNRLGPLHNGMIAAVGGFSCALGAVTVYRIGFVEGLLRA
jgi:hypothetical protein